MMGSNKIEAPYLMNSNGDKLYTDEDKEREYRNMWRNIFRIDDRDNVDFDQLHERNVKNFINFHEFHITP